MKNREKYPNTDDALKAFEEHNKYCDCGATFEEWLDHDPDKIPVGLGFAALSLALLSRMAKDAKKDAERKSEPTGDEKKPEKAGDIECPLCHGKHGSFRVGPLFPVFCCPDCKVVIANKDHVNRPFMINFAEFKAWFANLGKAARKD